MSEILTLRAYFAERQRSEGRFLAEAMLDLFEQRRIATSVMLRGIASFGPANVIRSDRSLSLSEDPPITISAVDTAQRIRTLADDVAGLIGRGVITLERSELHGGTRTDPDPDETVRLSLHLGRRHRIGGAPGYLAVCDVMHQRGFAGADVYLGVDGTVAGRRHRARFFSRNGDVPLSIVGVGTRAQSGTVVDELRAMLPGAVITVGQATRRKDHGRSFPGTPAASGAFQRLVVHTYESSRYRGRPVHRELIQRLRNSEHATGATVLRAIWGFRGTHRPQGDRILQLARHVPVTTVIVDTAPNIAAIYPIVDDVTEHEGMVTVESLQGMLEVHAGQSLGSLDLGDDRRH
jgi:PII-like signaling protein